MSSIKVNDLVVVVRFPCCHRFVGVVMRVEEIKGAGDSYSCSHCNVRYFEGQNVQGAFSPSRARGTGRFFPLPWLKKIDPPALPESVTEHQADHRTEREELEAG